MSKQEWPENSGSFAPDSGEFSAPIESRYTRERLIGRGGMGEVWQARDRVLRRVVALKVGRPELSESDALRLVREARITASLDHPGIVPVFDAGEDIEGQPFYTMRIVAGQGLDEAIGQASDFPARKALLSALLRACEALAFAHQAGVVHRDLKPANIRVGVFGEVQVMDWGLACAPEEDPEWAEVLSAAGTRTQAGVILGTPAYMAPEQARCESATPASDVWSLGLVLREILSGEKAYPGPSVEQQLAQLLAGPPRELTPAQADPELRAILAKALHPARGERYQNAGEMADDLRAYLLGDRVSAHRYSVKDELRRSLRRWRWPVGAVLAGAIGLSIAGTVGLVQAKAERARLELVQEELKAALDKADRNLAQALVSQASSAVDKESWGVAEVLAAQALTLAEDPAARGVLAGARTGQRPVLLSRVPGPDCPTGLMAGQVLICSGEGRIVAYDTDGLAEKWRMQIQHSDLVLSEEGERLFVFLSGGDFMVFDARDGSLVGSRKREWHLDRWAHSRDPNRLLSLRNGSGREYTVVGTQRERAAFEVCEERLQAAALLEGGALWYSCRKGHLAKKEGEETQALDIEPLVAFPWRLVTSVDQSMLAMGGMHGEVHVVDAATGQTRWFSDFGDEFVGRMRFSPDGRWLSLVTKGEGSWVVDLASGAKHQLPGMAREMAFSEDGELMTFGREGFETWSLPSGAPAYDVPGGVVSLDWHLEGLAMLSGNQAAFAPVDGALQRIPEGPIGNKAILVRSGKELMLGALERLFRWVPGQPRVQLGDTPVRRLHSLPDGRIFVTSIDNTQVLESDLSPVPGTLLVGFNGRESAASAEGRYVAAIATRGRLIWLDARSLEYRELGEFAGVQSVAVAPEGWPIYLGDSDGITALDESGERRPFLETGSLVTEMAVSDDGQLLAAACNDKTVRVLRRDSAQVLGVLRGHTRSIAALDFSPDSQQLASGGWDDRVLIWDLAALTVDPEEALAQAEQRWGLTTETALK